MKKVSKKESILGLILGLMPDIIKKSVNEVIIIINIGFLLKSVVQLTSRFFL